jgi:hypothetical protein
MISARTSYRLVRKELAAGMKALSASLKSPAPVLSQAEICLEKEWGCMGLRLFRASVTQFTYLSRFPSVKSDVDIDTLVARGRHGTGTR